MQKLRKTYWLDEDLLKYIQDIAKKENRSEANALRSIIRKEKNKYDKKNNK